MDDNEFEDVSMVNARKDEARKIYEGKSLHDLVSSMKLMRAKKDALDEELKIINAHYDLLRIELIPAAMEEEGVERVTYEGIGRVSLTGDIYARVTDKHGLMEWLSDAGFGDLIQPTVNAGTLKAFIKKRIKDNLGVPSDFVGVTPFTRASITAVK